jgi:putative acetyltransferase
MEIRSIQATDNSDLARIIRTVLTEFGANKPGTVFTDPTTDQLYELFQTPNAHYFVALWNGEIVGGCGLFPTKGLPKGQIELVKLYLTASTRGKGIGKALMLHCISIAKNSGYEAIYLETLPELHIAVGLYEKLGFHYLAEPLGDSGHFACDLWMKKQL